MGGILSDELKGKGGGSSGAGVRGEDGDRWLQQSSTFLPQLQERPSCSALQKSREETEVINPHGHNTVSLK